jgi:hypothetical protein
MKRYEISLNGCDDITRFNIELTEEEFNLINRIRDLSHEHSSYSCMPTMEIKDSGDDQ